MSPTRSELLDALAVGDLRLEGRLADASNATLRGWVDAPWGEVRCVYKPVRGERPLWDFPSGTLSGREVAFYELSGLLGWPLVPPTAWRADGPYGEGSCQLWIEADLEASAVDLVPVLESRDGWAVVLEGTDGAGRSVRLIHATTRQVQQLALLDAIGNNADRKGGHILIDASGGLWGIDHGVTFHADDKLRSVLWGWAGDEIPDDLAADVAGLAERLGAPEGRRVTDWLDEDEADALRVRIDRLLESRRFPVPSTDWPAIPWPVF